MTNDERIDAIRNIHDRIYDCVVDLKLTTDNIRNALSEYPQLQRRVLNWRDDGLALIHQLQLYRAQHEQPQPRPKS